MGYLDTFDFQMEMTRLFMRIGQRGIKVDLSEKEKQRKLAKIQLVEYNIQCKNITNRTINMNSSDQVRAYIYDELGMTVQYNRQVDGTFHPTADENAVKKLAVLYPYDAFLDLLLKWRKLSKLKSTYLDAIVDPDGRIRCSWGWNKTGRNNTSKNPFDTGMNLQNQPRSALVLEIIDPDTGKFAIINIKMMFMADDDCVLLEADGKQAEARVVAYWSEDKNYIHLFETNKDIHSINATTLIQYSEPGRIITKADELERHLGKICSHGIPYGMGVYENLEEIIKNLGMKYVLPIEQIKEFHKEYFKMYPGVKTGYQNRIRYMLEHGEPLINPLGRVFKCLYPINKKTLKEFYARIPQSTVPDIINRGILKWENMDKHMRKTWGYSMPILLQIHDSALMQVHKSLLSNSLYDNIKECFEIPIKIWDRTITIPMEIKVGERWGNMEEVA